MTDGRTLDEIVAGYNREAARAKRARDEYRARADDLAARRDSLQRQARSAAAEAGIQRQHRDEHNLTAKECRAQRDEWRDREARMRASGGLGDVGEARSQAKTWQYRAQKASDSADAAHRRMKELYERADELRAEADKCHRECLDCRKAADIEHENYIKAVRSIQRVRDELPD